MTVLATEHDHEGRVARMGICSVCRAAEVEAESVVEESPSFQGDLFMVTDGQVGAVLAWLRDGRWHTLREMSGGLDIPEQSVSARLRDLRKPEFGRHVVERKLVQGSGRKQIYQYRLVR